jgi:hypothetical protein
MESRIMINLLLLCAWIMHCFIVIDTLLEAKGERAEPEFQSGVLCAVPFAS